jgi:XTP/dITP diphosphohydrolase
MTTPFAPETSPLCLGQKATVLLATGNAHKHSEMQAMSQALGLQWQFLLPPTDAWEVPEDAPTFVANATLKAQALAAYCQAHPQWLGVELSTIDAVLADDSGYVVPALSGLLGLEDFPGVWSNRWLAQAMAASGELSHPLAGIVAGLSPQTPLTQTDKNLAIQTLMQGQNNRQAHYVCALAGCTLANPAAVMGVQGVMPLWVSPNPPQGEQGFGYDPINLVLDPVTGQPTATTVAQLSEQDKNALSHRGQAFKAWAAQVATTASLP